jgi:hypothetical protein
VEPSRPELRSQSIIGNGPVAEHPATQVAPADVAASDSAAMSGKDCAVSAATVFAKAGTVSTATMFAATVAAATMLAATVPAATMSPSMAPAVSSTVPATVPAATATAAGVCFECEKRHHEEQHRDQASAGRQHRPHSVAALRAPHHRGRLSLATPPRTKSF